MDDLAHWGFVEKVELFTMLVWRIRAKVEIC